MSFSGDRVSGICDAVTYLKESPNTSVSRSVVSHLYYTLFHIFSFTATSRLSFLGSDEDQEVRRLYGSGLAMRLATERNMAREVGGRGVSGLPTSNLMHDILTGNDMKIQFEDILSLPEHRPVHLKQDNPHTAMERKLGMM